MTTRKNIVKKLISEGFNRNTLIMMSDNELKTLCKTLFNEGVGAVVVDTNTSPDIIKKVTDKKSQFTDKQRLLTYLSFYFASVYRVLLYKL